ncbi:hypothetical protein NEHOM01_1613 [Nematocida homosporus]|uniref:uncharacterized protein n=1 Tax=Nematocida homosporus TaxID=1912981 RepID=UPI0022212713|nr:uncharacterized protein NEHOM01_1613 [Nematocida homosporus]KAI5186660.1 hypothetical protein NEHOM01_1613 [Nematocida homosporus]
MEGKKDSDIHANQSHIRRKIEMRYQNESPRNKENARSNVSMQIKKFLVNYHLQTIPTKRERQTASSQRECGFCKTTQTSLWRRIGDLLVCNACGLYYRIHGKVRDKPSRHRRAVFHKDDDTDKDMYESAEEFPEY